MLSKPGGPGPSLSQSLQATTMHILQVTVLLSVSLLYEGMHTLAAGHVGTAHLRNCLLL